MPDYGFDNLWQIFFYLSIVAVMIGTILILSFYLGPRHKERATHEIFESGIKVTGDSRHLFTAKFYVVAILFVIFDLEAVFFFAWASSVRDLGLSGYIEILLFAFTVFVPLIYFIKTGALDFTPKLRRPGDPFKQR